MAYISQEEKKVRLPAIKAVAKKFGMKVTVGVKHHSTLVVNVKDEMIVAMKGVGWFCNDDSQTDYFHRSFYTDINIGQWNKPYIQKGE